MEEITPRAYFIKGKQLLGDHKFNAACKNFYKAYRTDKENPEFLSYYGMSAAKSRGEIKLGLELCTKAIKKEFYRPHYYKNLAEVYLVSGNKKGAITALQKGIKYETTGTELYDKLVELGVRSRPIIPFLKRSNLINKILGVFFRHTIPALLRKKGPKGKQ